MEVIIKCPDKVLWACPAFSRLIAFLSSRRGTPRCLLLSCLCTQQSISGSAGGEGCRESQPHPLPTPFLRTPHPPPLLPLRCSPLRIPLRPCSSTPPGLPVRGCLLPSDQSRASQLEGFTPHFPIRLVHGARRRWEKKY